jgi:NADH:ubiquinone oxidoreductase subunit 6 (subunit J)
MANFLVWVVWVIAAFACVASALGVVTFRNAFFSALALIGNLASLAVLSAASSSRRHRCSCTAAP